jgi:hypothetical protein
MKILLLPLMITLLPMAAFVVLLANFKGRFMLLPLFKILLSIAFIVAGAMASFYAFLMSIHGMGEKGIKCMTGAVVFPMFGLGGYLAGIPLLFFLSKWGRSFDKQNFIKRQQHIS